MTFHSNDTRYRKRLAARTVTATLLAVCLLSYSGIAAAQLHVLLTNDDGYEAPGITAMHEALRSAGYRVTVVAPRDQQSGSSMRVTMSSIEISQHGENTWAIDGTPADSVAFALKNLLAGDRPDLVVSGANFGQNIGSNTNLSGTVGAALMANQLGVPGIAVSVGIDLAEASASPVRFPSTINAFKPAAGFIVRLIRELDRTRAPGESLLPVDGVLNVNYPGVDAAGIKGVRLTELSVVGGFTTDFEATETPGEFRVSLDHGDAHKDPSKTSDIVLFNAGYITLGLLNGSLDAHGPDATVVANRIASLLAGSGDHGHD